MTTTKSLSDRIAERAVTKKTSLFAQNRASFLVQKEDIKLALNDGWASKNIWEILTEEGKISFSYPTFNSYIKKLISHTMTIKTSRDEVRSKDNGKQDPLKKQAENNSHQSLLKGLPGFDFGKNLSKEDLI